MNALFTEYEGRYLRRDEYAKVAALYHKAIEQHVPQKFKFFSLISGNGDVKCKSRKNLHSALLRVIEQQQVGFLNCLYCLGDCVGACGGGVSFMLSDISAGTWPTTTTRRLFSATVLEERLPPDHPRFEHMADYPPSWGLVCYKCKDKLCELCAGPNSPLIRKKRPHPIMKEVVCQACYDQAFFHLQPTKPSIYDLRSLARQLRVRKDRA